MVKVGIKFLIAFIILVWAIPLIITFFVIQKLININVALPIVFIFPAIWLFSLFYWMFNFQNKRRRGLIKSCNELGLEYGLSIEESEKILSELKDFRIFNIGILPMMLHVIKGIFKGVPIVVFDYRHKGNVLNAGISSQGMRYFPKAGPIRPIHYQTIVYFYFQNKNIKKSIIDGDNFIIEANGKKVIYYEKDFYPKSNELSNFLDKALNNVNKFLNSKK